MSERITVIALGGNALTQRGQRGTFAEQYENLKMAATKLADLIDAGHKIVLTHGNGPQVGATLLRHEAARNTVPPLPLDACGAETQGFIGYMLQQSLGNELNSRGIQKHVVTIVTRTVVNKDDPAFRHPSKPIGPFYSRDDANKIMVSRPELVVKEDAGRGYRRFVPSPDPQIIAERFAIRTLVEAGFVVVACGGGGIPVVEEGTQAAGVEAVIDKDLAGQRLATLIGARLFVMLTDVPGVYLNYRTPKQEMITEITSGRLRNYLREGHFRKGSMAPKVEAAIRFVESGGDRSTIAHLGSLVEASEGRSGTNVSALKS